MNFSSVDFAAQRLDYLAGRCVETSPFTGWVMRPVIASRLGQELAELPHAGEPGFADKVLMKLSDETIKRIFRCERDWLPVTFADAQAWATSFFSQNALDLLLDVSEESVASPAHLHRAKEDFLSMAASLGPAQLDRVNQLLPTEGMRHLLSQAVLKADTDSLTRPLQDRTPRHAAEDIGRALSRIPMERRAAAIGSMTHEQRSALARAIDPQGLQTEHHMSREEVAAIFGMLPRARPAPRADEQLPSGVVRVEGGYACQATPEERGNGQLHLPSDPELRASQASPYRMGLQPLHTASFMIITNNADATEKGCKVLAGGGTAAAAAVATQAALAVHEAQSSGFAGGAMALHFDASTRKLEVYDGREAAPLASQPDDMRFIDSHSDHSEPLPQPRWSGRSMGVPGVVRMLEMLLADHGNRDWAELLEPSIQAAREGFVAGGRMAALLRMSGGKALQRDEEATRVFFEDNGEPKSANSVIKMPGLADTLERIARDGPKAFYTGPIAQAIVETSAATHNRLGETVTPGRMTMQDLENYKAVKREPVCMPYGGKPGEQKYEVCGLPPPSSAGITTLQILGMLDQSTGLESHRTIEPHRDGGVPQPKVIDLIVKLEKAGYADRAQYLADTDRVGLPGKLFDTLLKPSYLADRAAMAAAMHPTVLPPAGQFGNKPLAPDHTPDAGTAQISIVDMYGNAVAMTSSIDQGFGTGRMAAGMLMNNQMLDFSADPGTVEHPIANSIEGGKRPRATLSSTMVFGPRRDDGSLGDFELLTGSPGGYASVQFVVKALYAMLNEGANAQEAASALNYGAAYGKTELGVEHPGIDSSNGGQNDPLVTALRALGHDVELTNNIISGVDTIKCMRQPNGSCEYEGGVDPRREGAARGDRLASKLD